MMDRIEIKSQRLSVTMQYPGTYYKGSRFDWTGFITDVILDGKHSFCTDESSVPGVGTGGRGLCNEFGIEEPVGYDEAKVGEKFTKIGIGLLEKDNLEKYAFDKPYKISPFDFEVDIKPDKAVFISEPCLCNGYAVRLIKDVSVKENFLTIKYTLENTGQKTIETTEYVHNFINIDKAGIGPHMNLSFSFDLEGDCIFDGDNVLNISKREIEWDRIPNGVFYFKLEGLKEKSCWWMLENKITGTGIKEIDDFPVTKVALWGTECVVSPEIFINLSVEPGKTQTWTRTYEFFSKK